MLRWDVQISDTQDVVNLKVVEEEGDSHAICGRLVLTKKSWVALVGAMRVYDDLDIQHPAFKIEVVGNKP